MIREKEMIKIMKMKKKKKRKRIKKIILKKRMIMSLKNGSKE